MNDGAVALNLHVAAPLPSTAFFRRFAQTQAEEAKPSTTQPNQDSGKHSNALLSFSQSAIATSTQTVQHPNALKEPAFAVMHINGKQYKVSPGDVLVTTRFD